MTHISRYSCLLKPQDTSALHDLLNSKSNNYKMPNLFIHSVPTYFHLPQENPNPPLYQFLDLNKNL